MGDKEWKKEWPTRPGHYWFYGWRFSRFDRKEKPELSLVVVRISGNKKPMYITHGHFMYREEGAEGLWQEVDLPKFPSLSNLRKEA